MIKGLLILIVLLGMVMFALIVATATPNDKETHEAYERWKKKNGHGKSDTGSL